MLNIGNLMVDSLDYILIVDKHFRIVYNTRYDEALNENSKIYTSVDVLGKQYFDIYPKLDRNASSIAQCLRTGAVIVNKCQEYEDYAGRRFSTNNITFPLVRKGEIIAAVELAIDVGNDAKDLGYDGPSKIFDDFVDKLNREAGKISFDKILTSNDQMRNSIEKAKILARLPNPTLIYGETGTGKELFAQAMITHSQVPQNKVITQNCAAVPENLMEAILFGTVRGAYTGAENKKGLFEEADGGVLFLDELNSVPFEVQSKLLRVLQEGTFMPLGSNKEKHVSVKVIAAMNVEPMDAIDRNILRRDLFYRFSSGLISIPPLRERREDIGIFVNYYLDYFGNLYNKSGLKLSHEVKEFFWSYSWDGNVREMKNVIESMVTLSASGQELTLEQIPTYLRECAVKQQRTRMSRSEDVRLICQGSADIPYYALMEETEKNIILEALRKVHGNKTKAAEILGLPRQTLNYRMQKLGVNQPELSSEST